MSTGTTGATGTMGTTGNELKKKLPLEKNMTNFESKRLPLKVNHQVNALTEGSFVDRHENVLVFMDMEPIKPREGELTAAKRLIKRILKEQPRMVGYSL